MTTRKQSAAAKAKQEAEPNTSPGQGAKEIPPEDVAKDLAAKDGTTTEVTGSTVTGDGTGKALPPINELPGVFVRTKRRIKSRRRAGFRFNREGMGIALELLSEEQLQQLCDDPALEVEDCTFPLAEATSEPEV